MRAAIAGAALALACAGGAHAAVLDLGLGGANAFSFTDFKAPSADVEGAILVGRDFNVSHYTVNDKNGDAFGNYALIVGRNLSYNGGSIRNGDIYAGGAVSIVQADHGAVKNGATPVSLGALASTLATTSSNLSKVAHTGKAVAQWSTLNLTGSGSGVEVFDVSAAQLASVTGFSFSKLAAGSTLIFNVSGSSVALGGDYSTFAGYNVLFNFYQATSLKLASMEASVLAPLASVGLNSTGAIDGQVVVKDWNSAMQINAENNFKAVNVAGLAAAVPEPETWAMLLAGLGLVGFLTRRKSA
ncbi:choice-of-anchor A family protein [Oxalobacteraceae bacterium A2-2]